MICQKHQSNLGFACCAHLLGLSGANVFAGRVAAMLLALCLSAALLHACLLLALICLAPSTDTDATLVTRQNVGTCGCVFVTGNATHILPLLLGPVRVCADHCFKRQLQMLLLMHRPYMLQVFCSKVSPNCAACPLQTSCEYALGNGKKFQSQAASSGSAAHKVSYCQPWAQSCHHMLQRVKALFLRDIGVCCERFELPCIASSDRG